MDIKTGCGYPASALSNFAPHAFILDGVHCASMEGFLQSLKFESIEMQEYVCTLVGMKAKMKGRNKKWYRKQVLYWRGVEYKRDSKEYQELLDRAYNELNKNTKFRKALEATNTARITHSIGKNKINMTVLTEREMCSRLTRLRDNGEL